MSDARQQQQFEHEAAHAAMLKKLQQDARGLYEKGLQEGPYGFAPPEAGAPPGAPRTQNKPPARTPAEYMAPFQPAQSYRVQQPEIQVPAGQQGPSRPFIPGQLARGEVPSFFTRQQRLAQSVGTSPIYPYRDTYKKATDLARDAAGKSFVGLGEAERQRYINPHTRFVADEVARLGKLRLTEDILPALEQKFVRAGQHGSAAHKELMARAQRDVEREIGSQQRLALGQAYESGAKLYNEELMRNIMSSEMLGKSAIAQQQAEAKEIESMGAAHNRERMEEESNRSYNEQRAEEQRLWPMKMLQFWSDIMHGHPVGHTTTTTTHKNNNRSTIDELARFMSMASAFGGIGGGAAGMSNPYAHHGRGFAKGGSVKSLHKEAEDVRAHHAPGDTVLAHINPEELAFLERHFGGSTNPQTGLPQFSFWDDLWGGIKKYVPFVGGINNLVEGIQQHKSFGDIMGDTAKGWLNPMLNDVSAAGGIAGPIVGGVFGGPAGAMAGSALGNMASQLAGQLSDALNPPEVSPEERQAQQIQQYQQVQDDPYAASNPTLGAGQLRLMAQRLGQGNAPTNDYQVGQPLQRMLAQQGFQQPNDGNQMGQPVSQQYYGGY
jgi:hypothetical protein